MIIWVSSAVPYLGKFPPFRYNKNFSCIHIEAGFLPKTDDPKGLPVKTDLIVME